VLRGGGAAGSGDPRERALQALVRLAVEVRDPIRVRLLIERGSQVFGLAESVLQRAVALQRSGQGAEKPVAAAVREQRRGESDLERLLLRALLQSPEEQEAIRARLKPDDFRDGECRALAEWLWSGRPDLPDQGPEGVLARELVAEALPNHDWPAEVRGAVLLMERRALSSRKRELRTLLGTAADSAIVELQREDQRIAERLKEIERVLPENRGAPSTDTGEVTWR
jgi:hypothetical protein